MTTINVSPVTQQITVTQPLNQITVAGQNNVTVQPVRKTVQVSQPNAIVQVNGLQGIKGNTGASSSVTIAAPINLGGNRVVMANGHYADNTDFATVNKAIGLTQGAAITGADVVIVISTELDGFAGLTPNDPIYLSTNGTVTQTLPLTGYIQQVGVAISTTKILVNLMMPIAQ